MRITKHKGKPKVQTDWCQLDAAIEKLQPGEHLRVFPGRELSVKALRRKVGAAYAGVTTIERKAYLIVMLDNGG